MARAGDSRLRRARRARIETSAGGVIYRMRDEVPHILLIRDSYQHWGFPKGHVEQGETPAGAALREVREETGLGHLVLGPRLQTIDWFFRAGGRLIHKYCHFFLIESPNGDPVPQLEEGITACDWLPLHQALAQISYGNAREVLQFAAETLRGGSEIAPASSQSAGQLGARLVHQPPTDQIADRKGDGSRTETA